MKLHKLYATFIAPHSQDLDIRRREFILSILLAGLCALSLVAGLSTLVHQLSPTALHDLTSVVTVPAVIIIVSVLYALTRRGYSRPVAGLLTGTVSSIAIYYMLTWSFELPMAQLLSVLTIVLAGVLYFARAAVIVSGLSSALLLVVAYLQTHGHLATNQSWLGRPLEFADAMGAVTIFLLVGLITWLANTEIDRSLARARHSEASLAKERDLLEIRVRERTQELEAAQFARLIELQKFAEMGRISAGLLHDLTNPLTVASLNITHLKSEYQSEYMNEAARSLRHIERYILAARKQLLGGSPIRRFSVRKEVEEILPIVGHKARKAHVRIVTNVPSGLRLEGDSVKFNQLVANLVVNAIESYDGSRSGEPRVQVKAEAQAHGIRLTVTDEGKGIPEAALAKIYESFYTTKASRGRNMGLGLVMVKRIVEEDFKGTIRVKSSPAGTTFVIRLCNRKK